MSVDNDLMKMSDTNRVGAETGQTRTDIRPVRLIQRLERLTLQISRHVEQNVLPWLTALRIHHRRFQVQMADMRKVVQRRGRYCCCCGRFSSSVNGRVGVFRRVELPSQAQKVAQIVEGCTTEQCSDEPLTRGDGDIAFGHFVIKGLLEGVSVEIR